MAFEKSLYLPSGGLEYSPYAWVKAISLATLPFMNDAKASDSSFDMMLSIIKYHTKMVDATDISELYLQDFYYIWVFLYIGDISTDDNESTKDLCKQCNAVNTINVKLSNLKPTYNLKKTLVTNLNYKSEGMDIQFRRRKTKDNIEYGVESLRENSRVYYILPQITKLKYKDKVIPPNEYFDFLQNLNYKKIIKIKKRFDDRTCDFGLENTVIYTCSKCKEENECNVFDNINLATMTVQTQNFQSKVELYKNILSQARTPMFSFGSILDMPIRELETLSEAMKDMDLTTLF